MLGSIQVTGLDLQVVELQRPLLQRDDLRGQRLDALLECNVDRTELGVLVGELSYTELGLQHLSLTIAGLVGADPVIDHVLGDGLALAGFGVAQDCMLISLPIPSIPSNNIWALI